MATSGSDSTAYVESLRFVGRSTGPVKTLRGFRKGQHTLPDAVTPATIAFLGKLCADELQEEAETLFQQARATCAYKRKDLALDLSPGQAVLAARDFSLEIAYAFDDGDPATYCRRLTLDGVHELDFLKGEACTDLFSGRFSDLVFGLTKGAPVEAVIDAVEDLDDPERLRVDYPSDCAHCLLSVDGVDAQVRFDGAELAMIFPRAGAPAELLEGFLAVRSAFSLTKSAALTGLLK